MINIKIRNLFIIISVALMIFIFFNSAKDGTESISMSNSVLLFLESKLGIKISSFVVRKAAHFLEFAALGFSLTYALASRGDSDSAAPQRTLAAPRYKLSVIVGILYAATDEFHQLFVPDRAGQLRDILIDSCGVCAGVLVAFGIITVISIYVNAKAN